MTAPTDTTEARGFRAWWATPPRTGLQRVINPWAYRHLRVFASVHAAGACVAFALGLICFSDSAPAWAGLLLGVAAVNYVAGFWYLSIASSKSAQA